MNNEEIRKWAARILEQCDEKFKDEKELKMRIAQQYGFLRGSIEILLDHPEDIEFVVMRARKREKDMDDKKLVDKETG
jgi:hypothetical protein